MFKPPRFYIFDDNGSTMRPLKPRQDPVSCELCRAKKLKCNREQPCSNCIARGVTCRGGRSVTRSDTKQQPTEIPNILDRLQRLESTVLQQGSSQLTPLNDNGPPSKRVALTPTSVDTPAMASDVDQARDEESIALENVATRKDSLLTCLSSGLEFDVRSVADILRLSANPNSTLRHARILVPLPEYPDAVQLLRNYEMNVDYFLRVLHIPTIRSLLGNFYQSVRAGIPVRPSETALLLSIFAIAAYFSRPTATGSTNSLLPSNEDILRLSIILSKAALDVLDYSRRMTSGSIEDVQACIIMLFVLFHLDGPSARGRSLSAASIVIARDLRLHRTDDDDAVPDKDLSSEAMVEREVMRRVWWHITASDWLQSFFGGPQENFYLINRKHMRVKLPRNCLDEDIGTKPFDYEIPSSEPSPMLYFLYRTRLAELCREIVDALPFPSLKLSHLRYEEVMALDHKLEVFLAELPVFFQIDPEPQSREKVAEFEIVHRHLPALRYFINAAAQSRRCKLHQPFLIRQSVDPRYAFSRKACLESARAVVIQSQQVFQTIEPSPRAKTLQSVGAALHFMHVSIIVLVMDLCFNKDKADQAEQRTEVKAAFKVLEDITDISPLPGRFLSSLIGTLNKHKVQLPEPMTPNTTQAASTFLGAINLEEFSLDLASAMPSLADDPSSILDSNFEEFWQSAFQDPSLDIPQWEHLFTDIDSNAM